MAEITHSSLVLHLVQDAETGLAHFMAQVDGALIPIATEKLGHLERWVETGLNGSLLSSTQTPPSSSTPPQTPTG